MQRVRGVDMQDHVRGDEDRQQGDAAHQHQCEWAAELDDGRMTINADGKRHDGDTEDDDRSRLAGDRYAELL